MSDFARRREEEGHDPGEEVDTDNTHSHGRPRHLWVIGMARQWMQPAAESGLAANPAMTTWGAYGVAARTIEVEMQSRRIAKEVLTPVKTNGDALQPPCKSRQKGT